MTHDDRILMTDFAVTECLQKESERYIYYLLYFKEQYMKEIEYERD